MAELKRKIRIKGIRRKRKKRQRRNKDHKLLNMGMYPDKEI